MHNNLIRLLILMDESTFKNNISGDNIVTKFNNVRSGRKIENLKDVSDGEQSKEDTGVLAAK